MICTQYAALCTDMLAALDCSRGMLWQATKPQAVSDQPYRLPIPQSTHNLSCALKGVVGRPKHGAAAVAAGLQASVTELDRGLVVRVPVSPLQPRELPARYTPKKMWQVSFLCHEHRLQDLHCSDGYV